MRIDVFLPIPDYLIENIPQRLDLKFY